MKLLTLALALMMAVTLPATTAKAELKLRMSFTEKQVRTRGLGRSNDTCRTVYDINQFGGLLAIETVKSNCKTFEIGAKRGADGSASALVFEGPSSRQRKSCSYSAKSRTEACNDGSKVRLPPGIAVNYKATVDTRSRYQLSRSGLTATVNANRVLTTAEGSKQVTEAGFRMKVALQGNKCQLTELVSSSTTQVTEAGRGRAVRGATQRESRKLVKAESCQVISR
ncbi:hypothetical protein [Vannielia litorea]|uniref:hypothetical protein n=1 Tax=Vannielia litorea TaxID=1217970 RepID=UPI001C961BFD|nr:hypothetical protein [Vannielia litorea]MBY6049191.1 hypothetical protein [Vannielia litorea]MBY6076605.1 hypothetical protein [Vannielia litorea]